MTKNRSTPRNPPGTPMPKWKAITPATATARRPSTGPIRPAEDARRARGGAWSSRAVTRAAPRRDSPGSADVQVEYGHARLVVVVLAAVGARLTVGDHALSGGLAGGDRAVHPDEAPAVGAGLSTGRQAERGGEHARAGERQSRCAELHRDSFVSDPYAGSMVGSPGQDVPPLLRWSSRSAWMELRIQRPSRSCAVPDGWPVSS